MKDGILQHCEQKTKFQIFQSTCNTVPNGKKVFGRSKKLIIKHGALQLGRKNKKVKHFK